MGGWAGKMFLENAQAFSFFPAEMIYSFTHKPYKWDINFQS
jgi:hypothetical protein